MPAKKPYPKIGVGVIIERDGKILLGLRTGTHAPGTWGIPGGAIEFGESPEEAAIREVFEETGMRISTPVFVAYSSEVYSESGKHYISFCFRAGTMSGEPVERPHENTGQWGWYAPEEFPKPLFLSTANVLRAAGILPLYGNKQ